MQHLSLISLLTPIFSALMILRAVSLFRKGKQSWRELFLWLLVWSGIAFVSMVPESLDLLPPVIGIKSGVNVLIFFGFVLLFYGFFRLVVKVEELERKIVMMNREKALSRLQKDDKQGAMGKKDGNNKQ